LIRGRRPAVLIAAELEIAKSGDDTAGSAPRRCPRSETEPCGDASQLQAHGLCIAISTAEEGDS
jgi:hypothetical protein